VVRAVIDARKECTEDVVEEAARVIFSGGTLVFPDETGYLLACDLYRGKAVAAIYAAAGKEPQMRVAVCVASTAEFIELTKENLLAVLAVKRVLPAPVMLIVRRPSFFSEEQTSGRLTVGFRVPEDPFAHAILERCGPLIAGGIEYRGDGNVADLPDTDLLVERGPISPSLEVTIVDLTGDRARLLHEGAVPYDRLATGLGAVDAKR